MECKNILQLLHLAWPKVLSSFVMIFILKGLPIHRPEEAEQYRCGSYNMDIFSQ